MGLFKRGNVWWYAFEKGGKRYTKSTRTSDRTKAEEVERQAKAELGIEYRVRREVADPGIYCLQSPLSGLVKVGCSGNVAERITHYRTANPEELFLLAKIPAADFQLAEAVFHGFLEPFHVKGEWYRIDRRHIEAAILFWATGHPRLGQHRKTDKEPES